MLALPSSEGAWADEPRSAAEPRIMLEPGEVTNVIDAFDDLDSFDLNFSLGFSYSSKSARILRETHIREPGLTTGGYTADTMNVAEYTETTSRLIPRLDIGIYKDFAAYVRLPIILNNQRRLDDLDGSAGRAGIVAAGAPGETLFRIPFESPERSGLEYLAAGLEFDALNQARDRTKPTWLLGVEGRFSIGTPMHACDPGGQGVACADPADIDRDGVSDGPLEGQRVAERDPGVTRGTTALVLRTLVSKRIKYVEPYGGFSTLFEFQQESSDYGISDVEQTLVNHPPLVGTMTLGVMIIPWEDRERFGRLTFDLRLDGTYRSEGRDYSELFDALGSSSAPSLRNPHYARYAANPDYSPNACADGDPATPCRAHSVVDESSQKTYFSGLTVVQAHGSYRASASATWQASEYVKFTFGLGFRHDQSHLISADQPCNPDLDGNLDESGPCATLDQFGTPVRSNGVPNPNYRPTINAVGRRFLVDASNTFDLFLAGVVMF